MQNFLIVGITIASLLALLIFTKKNKSGPELIFGIWQLVLVAHFALLYVRYSGLHWEFPHLLALDTSFGLLHSPLLYFYIQALAGERKMARMEYLLHFIPFMVINIIMSFGFYFLTGDEKIEAYRTSIGEAEVSITDFMIMAQGVTYFFVSLRLVRRYNHRIKEKYSSIEKINIYWLNKVLFFFGLGYGLNILLYILFSFKLISSFALGGLNIINFSGLLIFLAYYGVSKTYLFSYNPEEVVPHEKKQYLRSGLSEEDSKLYLEKLKEHMSAEKPFLNGELTLVQLAEQLNMSTNHLSQIINQQGEKTFYDFVNEYRVNEAKEKLADEKYDHFKILAIGFDAGFNSKSVFNSFFKKVTHTTPSLFRQNRNQ